MVALAAGAVFAGEFGAAFCAGLGGGVCAAAKFATSNELHRNSVRVKLGAHMRKAPRNYCIKRCYERVRRMGTPYSQCKETCNGGAGLAKEKILDMANKKRNTGYASR